MTALSCPTANYVSPFAASRHPVKQEERLRWKDGKNANQFDRKFVSFATVERNTSLGTRNASEELFSMGVYQLKNAR